MIGVDGPSVWDRSITLNCPEAMPAASVANVPPGPDPLRPAAGGWPLIAAAAAATAVNVRPPRSAVIRIPSPHKKTCSFTSHRSQVGAALDVQPKMIEETERRRAV